MVIYLDLVVGLNFLVDLMLILGTNRLCGFSLGLPRAAMAAALGAIYAAGAMLPGFWFLQSGFWRTVFLIFMGALAFGVHPGTWKRTGIFLLLNLAMGGMAAGLNGSGFLAVILSAGGVYLLSRICFGGSVGGKEYIPVTVTEGDRTATVIALKDTGNALRDPISGEQVLVLGPDAAEKLLGLREEALKQPLETLSHYPGLRLIPYNAVGQPKGLLVAKRFSNVKLGDRQCSAVVAFAPERIGSGQMYQALAGGNI